MNPFLVLSIILNGFLILSFASKYDENKMNEQKFHFFKKRYYIEQEENAALRDMIHELNEQEVAE